MKKNHFTGKYFVILLAATLIFAVIIASKMLSSRSFQKDVINTDVAKIETQSENTEVNSIEADLEETNFDTLDKELQDIDAEMQTAL